mmetsp:Transcript_9979/g.14602  ORF Transcript_9979/g.14602 Transcript_9979/m.14602 type:complete len:644 (-) Transcript_9979:202-2133(-)
MEIKSSPTFLIIGAAGDGKSSIIKKLISEEVPHEKMPETGRNPDGVTKVIKAYTLSNGFVMIDTMGIGDVNVGIDQLIAGVKSVLEGAAATKGAQVDGIIVTCHIATGRLGIACQILQQIIKHGLVKDSNGISPWERVIVCGTQRDRCEQDEIKSFAEKTGPHFFKGKVEPVMTPRRWQVTSSSSTERDGLNDLLQCLQEMTASGRSHISWNPNFDTGRMAVGLCEVTNGDVDLTRLQLEKQIAWSELVHAAQIGDLTELAGKSTSCAATSGGGNLVSKEIVGSVGKEFIEAYTVQNAAGVGSGVLKSSAGGLLLQEGSEHAVGQTMMGVANGAGKATLKSSTGNIIVDVGTRKLLAQGAQVGSGLAVGAVGCAAELVAGHFEATKDHKKKIGFSAQTGTAACYGFAVGGVPGAVVSAGVATLCWVSCDVVGTVIENIFINSKSGNHPAAIKYQRAKEDYEKALKVIGGENGLNDAYSSVEVLCVQPGSSLVADSPPQEPLVQQCPSPNLAMMEPASHQPPSSQLPITTQLLQSKFPTCNFNPIAAEVVQVEEAHVSCSSTAVSVPQNLSNATTEEVCRWLSKHGISKMSLDILRREEIDGTLLFKESAEEVKSVLKEEGVKAGQIARIRDAIADAKREGSLN